MAGFKAIATHSIGFKINAENHYLQAHNSLQSPILNYFE